MPTSTSSVLDFLRELIEGGFIGQAVIGTAIWGVIVYLIVVRAQVDNRLYDAGFIVIGYLFHMAQTAAASRAKAIVARLQQDCPENDMVG